MTTPASSISRKQQSSSPVKSNRRSNTAEQSSKDRTAGGWKRSSQQLPNAGRSSQQRSSGSSTGSPVANGQSQSSRSQAGMRNRLLHLYAEALWTHVTVTLKNGAQYHGYLSSIDADGDTALSLYNAIQVSAPSESTDENAVLSKVPVEELIIKSEHFCSMQINGLDLNGSENAMKERKRNNAFATDTDISGGRAVQERELQRWVPDADIAAGGLDEGGGVKGPWDQFSANEKLFGVKSDYSEDLYTTKIDRSHPEFRSREERAARIAREIESEAATSAHIAEERNQKIDNLGLTEEELYSGVDRRKPAAVSNGGTPQPGNFSADPAIISSRIEASDLASTEGPRLGKEAKADEVPSISAPSMSKVKDIRSDLQSQFKQFATSEREKIIQRKERSSKEKSGKIQDLLRFSQEFKVPMPVPEDLVPILAKDKAKQAEILEKYRNAGLDKPAGSPTSSSTDAGLGQRMANIRLQRKQGESPRPSVSPTPVSPSSKSQMASPKLNVKAASFKPNPSAASFTPGKPNAPSAPRSPAASTAAPSSRPSTTKSVPPFFPNDQRPKVPASQRSRLLDDYNPFKRFKAANPDSSEVIEKPFFASPLWFPPETKTTWQDLFNPGKSPGIYPQSGPSGSSYQNANEEMNGAVNMQSPQYQHQVMYGQPGMAPMYLSPQQNAQNPYPQQQAQHYQQMPPKPYQQQQQQQQQQQLSYRYPPQYIQTMQGQPMQQAMYVPGYGSYPVQSVYYGYPGGGNVGSPYNTPGRGPMMGQQQYVVQGAQGSMMNSPKSYGYHGMNQPRDHWSPQSMKSQASRQGMSNYNRDNDGSRRSSATSARISNPPTDKRSSNQDLNPNLAGTPKSQRSKDSAANSSSSLPDQK